MFNGLVLALTLLASPMLITSTAAAQEVSADIGHGFSHVTGVSALDPTFNKPIDYTPLVFDFTDTSGKVLWGASAELAQNGRAGVAADKVLGHASLAFHVGPATILPQFQIGYSRAPNLDYGVIGGEMRVSVPTPFLKPLHTEFAIRYRQSFGVNYFANLKGSLLPTGSRRETRYTLEEVYQISKNVAVGIHGDMDSGSTPDTVVGTFVRLSW